MEAEPASFLLQELGAPARHNAVLSALAAGRNTPKEIGDRTGIPDANVSQALQRLEELTLVRRVRPAVLRKARQVRYEVPGNLSCFSHCFRGKYETAIQAGLFDEVARRIVVGELPTYMGHVFEDVCRQWFLWEDRGDRLDVAPLEVRRWWGTNPVERCEEEIDIVLSGVDGELILGGM